MPLYRFFRILSHRPSARQQRPDHVAQIRPRRSFADPERFRLGINDVAELQGGEPAANAERLERILGNGSADPSGLAAVLLNAGAAIYVAGIAGSLAEGIGRAREVVASGAARAALDRLRKATANIS